MEEPTKWQRSEASHVHRGHPLRKIFGSAYRCRAVVACALLTIAIIVAVYFAGMAVTIAVSFGGACCLENGLVPFIANLFVLGFFGGNFALFSLWLPEQFETRVRATAFAFCTSFGRFVGAGVDFLLGVALQRRLSASPVGRRRQPRLTPRLASTISAMPASCGTLSARP